MRWTSSCRHPQWNGAAECRQRIMVGRRRPRCVLSSAQLISSQGKHTGQGRAVPYLLARFNSYCDVFFPWLLALMLARMHIEPVNSPSINSGWKLWLQRCADPLHRVHAGLSFSSGCSNTEQEYLLKDGVLSENYWIVDNILDLNVKIMPG